MIGQRNIKTIALLPVLDLRGDPSTEIDLQKDIRLPAQEILVDKGYKVIVPNTFGEGKSVDARDVAEMNDYELKSLVPEGVDGIMLVYLNDLRSEWGLKCLLMLTYEFDMEIRGRLVSRNRVFWHDKASETLRDASLIHAIIACIRGKFFAYGNILDCLFSTLSDAHI